MTRRTNAKIAGYAFIYYIRITYLIGLVVAGCFIVKGVADPVRRQPA